MDAPYKSPVERERAADGVIAATTLQGKLAAALDLFAPDFDDADRARVSVKLTALESELDRKGQGYSGETRGGAVSLRRLYARGLHAFHSEVKLDVDALPGRVVAVVGPGGAGKSTLVETMLLALYRRGATRGDIKEMAAGDDLKVAVEIATASGEWRVTQRLDGAFVRTLPMDTPVFKGGTSKPGTPTEFVAWQKRAAPPLRVLMATQFGAQEGDGQLVGLDPAPAKDLLLSLTGGEVYQRIATEAGKKARALQQSAARLDGQIREAERAAGVLQQERDLVAAIAVQLTAEEAQLTADRVTRDDRAGAAAVDPGTEYAQQATAARALAQQARRTHASARGRIATGHFADQRAAIRRAVEDLAAAQQGVIDAKAAHESAAHAVEVLYQDEQGGIGPRRIDALRAGIVELLGLTAKKAQQVYAANLLEHDDRMAGEASSLPSRIAAAEDTRRARRADLAAAEQRASDLRALAARMPEVERAERAEAMARDEATAAGAEAEEADAQAERLEEAARVAREGWEPVDLSDVNATLAARERVVSDLRARSAAAQARAEQAERAGARVAELQRSAQEGADELADWEVLEAAFGRNGIQALEVEGLGPALADHATQLLEEHAHGRWAVQVQMSKQDAQGIDTGTFAVVVVDPATGKPIRVRALSPGQRVLVGEAVTAAFSRLSFARSPGIAPTVVRDESAVYADKNDCLTWVRMLRAEAMATGANKVFIVTHDAKVMKACDTTIVVKDGTWSEVRS